MLVRRSTTTDERARWGGSGALQRALCGVATEDATMSSPDSLPGEEGGLTVADVPVTVQAVSAVTAGDAPATGPEGAGSEGETEHPTAVVGVIEESSGKVVEKGDSIDNVGVLDA